MANNTPSDLSDEQKLLQARIVELRDQHGEIDSAIEALRLRAIPDELKIKRLKKEKLYRKDEIAKLGDLLFPDIIA